MATATVASREMKTKEQTFLWEGTDRNKKPTRGELRAISETVATTTLRRQGIRVTKIKRQSFRGGRSVSQKDITFFTRQLATMLRAGVPLLQSFDIIARGHSNAKFSRLMMDIKNQVETGSSLSQAFRQYPKHFDALYCNLVQAGETAGMLDAILERLAIYMEKILAIKSKIKSALFYPITVLVVALIVTWIIMVFVIPSFKSVFASFGANLPYLTLLVIAVSDFFVAYWWAIFLVLIAAGVGISLAVKRSEAVRYVIHRYSLKIPVVGTILEKATIARWTRTLQTMFAAGVPLVESLDAVGGASGNLMYVAATKRIQTDVSTGTSLTNAMSAVNLFPSMVIQMTQIGEESGSLDNMLGKIADFYEREVDDAVAALSSLLEPVMICFLGVFVGGLVVAMYLPIFKLGAVI
ncbi:MAG: type II secretion system F family protein [Betaproteobacteria bacterium]